MNLLFPVEKRKAQQDCYPWYHLQLPRLEARSADLPAIGALPRDWKWGADFLPAILRWLHELVWLQPDDNLPEGHSQVSFLELALDFESHGGRRLPLTRGPDFQGQRCPCRRKGEYFGWRSPCWARQWERRPSSRRQLPPDAAHSSRWGLEQWSGQGAALFYEAYGCVRASGTTRGPQYQVEEQKDHRGTVGPPAGVALFTPPKACPKARRPEAQPQPPRLWLCPTHQHRHCASCAAVGRGLRHC